MPPRVVKRSTDGFTLIELTIVLIVVGAIVAFAVGNYIELVRNTRALRAVADLYAIRAAAYLNYGDTATWPPERPAGVPPVELLDRLPAGFRFVSEHYKIDWENWSGVGGAPGPRAGITIGVSVVSPDARLLRVVEGLLTRTNVVRTAKTKMTLQILGPNGL